jgi:hypothetical protein
MDYAVVWKGTHWFLGIQYRFCCALCTVQGQRLRTQLEWK